MPVVRNLPVGHGDFAWFFRGATDPDTMVATMSFDFTAQPDAVVVDDIIDAWGDTLLTVQSAAITLTGGRVYYRVDDDDFVVVERNLAVPRAGGGSGTSTPYNSTFLVRKVTALAGRKNRGRMYPPGVPEDVTTVDGALTSAALTALNSAAAALFTRLSTYGPEVVHSLPFEEGDPVPTPRLPTPITSLAGDDHIATQRRRLNR